MADFDQFKLTRPCRNCPFRNDETRIVFGDRDRAVEIEEQAYRRGFPCHETADCREDPVTGEEGYVFGEGTSFCIGYVIMRLKADGESCPWPAIDNDEEFLTKLSEKLGAWWKAPVFANDELFFEANSEGRDSSAAPAGRGRAAPQRR